MTALEPCPHCGNAHNEYQDYGFQHWISCPSCEMLGPDSPSEEEAAAAWNALPRPSDVTALKARAEAAEAERDRLAARVAALEACRIGYASEFPPATKADRVNDVLPGDPDVGRVHENIRALKARVAEFEACRIGYASETADDIDPIAMLKADAKFDRMGIVEVCDAE